jgi:Holliday junction resolvase
MTEAEFSHEVVSYCRRKGYFVQRIESGTMGKGIPDLFVANKRGQIWFELKSVRYTPHNGMLVPWRPGQQAWMLDYYRRSGLKCYTLIRHPTCYTVIAHDHLFPKGVVYLNDADVYHKLEEFL